MNDDEKFTNRHGHTITAVQEAVSALPEPEYKTKTAEPRARRKRPHVRLTKTHWGIIGSIVAVLIIIPLLVGEYVGAAYGRNVDDAKRNVRSVFSTVLAQQKTAHTSRSLTDAANQLSSIRDGLCPGGFLDNLAKLYPRAQQAYDACASYRSTVTALVDQVTIASSQMAYLENLQPLLDGVAKPLEDQFAVLSAQQENWQTFVDSLGAISAPLSFAPAHANLLKEATNVRDQWIALVQATNAQNSAEFRAARTKLTESFAAFRAQATVFSDAVHATQVNLSKAVTSLQ